LRALLFIDVDRRGSTGANAIRPDRLLFDQRDHHCQRRPAALFIDACAAFTAPRRTIATSAEGLCDRTILPCNRTILPCGHTILLPEHTIVPHGRTIVPHGRTIVPHGHTIVPQQPQSFRTAAQSFRTAAQSFRRRWRRNTPRGIARLCTPGAARRHSSRAL
jgi:hypothetical protein